VPGVNLIQNGDFIDEWANGWARDPVAGSGIGIVDVRPLEDEPEIRALHVEKTGPGMLLVSQRVALAGPASDLTFEARLRLSGSRIGPAQGHSALVLRYEDANGDSLG
jgi:hypothetical protein